MAESEYDPNERRHYRVSTYVRADLPNAVAVAKKFMAALSEYEGNGRLLVTVSAVELPDSMEKLMAGLVEDSICVLTTAEPTPEEPT